MLGYPIFRPTHWVNGWTQKQCSKVGEDLRLLEGYARALWKGGYASLLEELDSEPCLGRKEAILQGDTHAGFPWPPEWEEHEAREALLEEFRGKFEAEELKDPWTFRGREKRCAQQICRDTGARELTGPLNSLCSDSSFSFQLTWDEYPNW